MAHTLTRRGKDRVGDNRRYRRHAHFPNAERTAVAEASERKDGVVHTIVGDLTRFLHQLPREVDKLLFIGPPDLFPRFSAELGEVLVHPCTLVNSEPDYFEVLPPGVSKGTALQELASCLGLVLSQIVAFGDSLNDIEMLEAAGLGVALGNAHPALARRAGVVIGHHGTDTIARFLEESFEVRGDTLVPRG